MWCKNLKVLVVLELKNFVLKIFIQWLESCHINICIQDHFVMLFLCCGQLNLGAYN